MNPKFIEELRQKYIKNPPQGGISYYTKKRVCLRTTLLNY